MRISVVIPAFNEEKRIAACLRTVYNQTLPAFEVIVVDNNSTDDTAKIAKQMGATVIIEKNQGVTFARNTGFNLVQGDVIARTDADTIVPTTWIEQISRHFENDKQLDALSGPAVFGISVFSPLLRLLVFEANKRIFGHYGLFGPNLAIRKSAWIRIKDEVCMDDDKVHEDTDLSIHIGKGGKVGYDKNLKVRTSARRLRQSPSSLLVEYLIKWADMIAFHKKYRITRLASNIRHKMSN
ncbi:MAG: glycosyltransferase family A protein [Candidatus Levybacteria bacterium]|nr:glycosyltransferase family A protein [Candidatus Levybacteria bacterium]